MASPQQVLAARVRAVDRMCQTLYAERPGSPALAEAASLAARGALTVLAAPLGTALGGPLRLAVVEIARGGW